MKRPVREYSCYLFDADGTLFDTTEMIVRCFTHTAKVHNLSVPDRYEIISHIGMTLRRQMECYFGALSDDQFAEYRDAHMDYQLKIYKEHLQLCPGVADALQKLRDAGKKCVVVTSRMSKSLVVYLKETGIIHHFDALVTPESTSKHKPEPEPALEGMRLVGANPAETLFIGDATFDIECGGSAGCATAFVSWSLTPVEDLKRKPDYCIANMEELCAW